MKRGICYILIVLFFTNGKTVHAQYTSLTIIYSYTEKSKDSHSVGEVIDITGTNVTYRVKFSGRRGPDQKDKTTECILTKEQTEKIWGTIRDRKLNITDSLIDDSMTDNSFKVTAGITIMMINGTRSAKIKVKGNPSVLEGKPLYKNSLYLFNQVKGMLKSCQ